MCNVLWLDNDAAVLQPYAEKLAEHDIDVTLVADAEEALRILLGTETFYECLILDLRFYKISEMPDDETKILSGFDFLSKIVEEAIDIPICILSSYLQLDEVHEKLEDYRNETKLNGIAIDKYVDDIDSEVFKIKFIDKIVNFIDDVENERLHSGIISEDNRELIPGNPFQLKYESYLHLSKTEQREVRRKARRLAKSTLEKARDDGAVWVLLLGSKATPHTQVDSVEEIWGRDKIKSLANDRDRVPFQFRVNSRVEDRWGHCGASHENASYPKIPLSCNDGIKDSSWYAHFDTGSYESFFSLEEFIDIGMFVDYADLIDDVYRGTDYSYRREPVKFTIKKDDTGETVSVSTFVNLVEGWDGSPFLARCVKGCTKGVRVGLGFKNCINRVGLIGRSILINDGLSVIYDPQNPVVKVNKN